MIRDVQSIQSVSARVRVPGSKSLTNRALICASLAQGESVIHNASDSEDTALLLNGLNQLGILVRRQGETLIVAGTGGHIYAPKFPIPVGNAGTTLRFLLSLSALADDEVVLEGSARMAERPIAELLQSLSELGTEARMDGLFGRYVVRGGTFEGGSTVIRSEASSQFLSSLMMVGSYARQDVFLQTSGSLVSAPYLQMTLQVMNHFGVTVRTFGEGKFHIAQGQLYKPTEYSVEADASSASYFYGAAAIVPGDILVEGMKFPTVQGDGGFLNLLKEIGCEVILEEQGIRLRGNPEISGIDVDMNSMPDMVPTLTIIALCASTPTRIRNVAHLRHKESDRLLSLAGELHQMGAHITVLPDGFTIVPAPLSGSLLDPHDDHRLAMSFAILGLRIPGVRIENPECVRKSFPQFWKQLDRLYDHERDAQ
jgi:3-phosphoshikimate 1-carboxyvinyltransferase